MIREIRRPFGLKAGAVFAAAALVTLASACGAAPDVQKRDAVRMGDAFVAEGKYREAVIAYRNALQADPRFAEAHAKLADVLVQLEDFASAVPEYARAADLVPGDKNAQLKAGKALLFTGQYEDARHRAEAILKSDPTNSDALVLLGSALARLKDPKGAVEALEQAITGADDKTTAMLSIAAVQQATGDTKRAETAFANAVRANPRSIPARLALGNFYWSTNRRADAERILKETLQLAPDDVLTNRALAILTIVSGHPADAEPYFRKVALQPSADPGSRVLLADYYRAMGRRQDAQAILTELKTIPKGYGPAQVRLAVMAFTANQGDAYRMVDELLQKEPNNPDGYLAKGRFLISDKRFDDALPLLNRALEINPRMHSAHLAIGDIYQTRGEWDAAIASYGEVLKLQPTLASAQVRMAEAQLAKGQPETSVSFATQAVKNEPANGLAHLALARGLVALRKLPEAEAELDRLTAVKALTVSVQEEFGRLRLAQGRFAEARAAFARASQLNPGSRIGLEGLVAVAVAEKDFGDAITLVEAAIAKRPDDSDAHLLAARVYEAAKDPARAERALRAATRANPNGIDAYLLLASLYGRSGRLDDARTEFERVTKASPKSVAAHTMLGMVLQLQNRPAEARAQYEQALQADSRAALAANNLAWMLADEGEELDRALNLAQTATSQLPNRHDISDTLGWVYYKKGLFTQAASVFRECAASAPSNASYHYHLGLALAQQGKKTDARQSLERALTLSPTFAGADEARRVLQSMR